MANMLQIAQMIAAKRFQNGENMQGLPPWGAAAIQAIMNGDAQTGQQLANNILSSYGTTQDQVVQQLKQMNQ